MPGKPRFRVERLDVVEPPAQSAQAGVDTQAAASPWQFGRPCAVVNLVFECERDTSDVRRVEDNFAVGVNVRGREGTSRLHEVWGLRVLHPQ